MKSSSITFKMLIHILIVTGASTMQTSAIAREFNKVKVGIVDNQLPCSDYNGKEYVGSAVDLWRAVAERTLIKYELQTIKTPNDAVEQANNGETDIAISCLNIIPQRLNRVQFSVPYQSDSLAFLSKAKDNVKLIDIFQKIFSSKIIVTSLLLLYGITFIASIVLWKISNGFKNKDVECAKTTHTFLKGWMMLAMGGGIYKLADRPHNMSIITVINILRLVISSILVGSIASIIFYQKTPEDGNSDMFLRKTIEEIVGVDKGTISELWIVNEAIKIFNIPENYIIPISGDERLLESLKTGKVGSILADHQRIIMLDNKLGKNDKFHVAANTFNETPQGFIFGRDLADKERKKINIEIANLMFSGEVEAIRKRWKQ